MTVLSWAGPAQLLPKRETLSSKILLPIISFKYWPLQGQEEHGVLYLHVNPRHFPLFTPGSQPAAKQLQPLLLLWELEGLHQTQDHIAFLWRVRFLTMDVRPVINVAGLNHAAPVTPWGYGFPCPLRGAEGARSSPDEELRPMEDALRGQVVLFGLTFGRQICPRLWWWAPHGSVIQQSLSLQICLDSPIMCKPLGIPVLPYESYTSSAPATWHFCPFPVLELSVSPHPIAEPGAEGRSQEGLCRR